MCDLFTLPIKIAQAEHTHTMFSLCNTHTDEAQVTSIRKLLTIIFPIEISHFMRIPFKWWSTRQILSIFVIYTSTVCMPIVLNTKYRISKPAFRSHSAICYTQKFCNCSVLFSRCVFLFFFFFCLSSITLFLNTKKVFHFTPTRFSISFLNLSIDCSTRHHIYLIHIHV